MQIVSHYANVPITTTNTATDNARIEYALRPQLMPLKQSGQSEEEGKLKDRHDRATEQEQQRLALLAQHKKQGKHKQSQQRQTEQSENKPPQQQTLASNQLNAKFKTKPSIKFYPDNNKIPSQMGLFFNHHLEDIHKETLKFYRHIGQNIKDFYSAQTTPHRLASMELKA